MTLFGFAFILYSKKLSKGNGFKTKNIRVLGEGITQGLDDTILTAEKKYSINFTENNKKFCLSLHYNGARYRNS